MREAKPIRREGKVGYDRLFFLRPRRFYSILHHNILAPRPLYKHRKCDYREPTPQRVVLREEQPLTHTVSATHRR